MTISDRRGHDPIRLGEDLHHKTCLRLSSNIDPECEISLRVSLRHPRLFIFIHATGTERGKSYSLVGAWTELCRPVSALPAADENIPEGTIFQFSQHFKLESKYLFRSQSPELGYENDFGKMSTNKDFPKKTRNLGTSSPTDLPQSPDGEEPQPVGNGCDAGSSCSGPIGTPSRRGERQPDSCMGCARTVPSSYKNEESKDVPSQSPESQSQRTNNPPITDSAVNTKFVHVDTSNPASSTLASDQTLSSSSVPESYESLKLLGISRRKKNYPSEENDNKNPEVSPRVSSSAQTSRNVEARASFSHISEEYDDASDEEYFSADKVVDEKRIKKILMADKSTDTYIRSPKTGAQVNKPTNSLSSSGSSTILSSDTDTASLAVQTSYLTPAHTRLQEISTPSESSQAATPGRPCDPRSDECRNQTRVLSEAATKAAKELGVYHPKPGSDSLDWDASEHFQSSKTSLKKKQPNDNSIPLATASTDQEVTSPRGNNGSVSTFADRKSQSDTFLGNGSSHRHLENKLSGTESSKSVRFADDFGMNLVNVKDVPNTSSPPYIPEWVLASFSKFLDEEEKEDKPISFTYLSPSFNQPGGENNFLNVVNTQNICLENVMVNDLSIAGFVRVKCPSPRKRVVVRYTTNSWFSQEETEASLLPNSSVGGTDSFSFKISAPDYLTPGSRLTLMLICSCDDSEFIDNNGGAFYDFECFSKAHSSVGL